MTALEKQGIRQSARRRQPLTLERIKKFICEADHMMSDAVSLKIKKNALQWRGWGN